MEDADRHGGLLFSKLIGFDAEGNPKNEVADSIEVNDGNTEYTITLKKGRSPTVPTRRPWTSPPR